MTNAAKPAEPVIRIAFVLSDWIPDSPYFVSHSEFGHYMAFERMDDAIDYAFAVAEMMDLVVEIVA